MKWPTKKSGLPGAPTDPAKYAKLIDQWLHSRPYAEKMRVVAASQTDGDLEARVRFKKDGTQEFSLWLCLRDTDESIKLIPAPLEDGPHAGDVR